jgi:hypothetical protein
MDGWWSVVCQQDRGMYVCMVVPEIRLDGDRAFVGGLVFFYCDYLLHRIDGFFVKKKGSLLVGAGILWWFLMSCSIS